MTLKPLQRENSLSRSLVEQVVINLRFDITCGRLEPGTRLRIDELARRFEVSPIPVREALRVLESEGLVVITAQKGAEVAATSLEDMLEIYSLRLELDGQATRQACQRREPGWLEEVAVALAQLEQVNLLSESAEMAEQAEKAHSAFHLSVYAGCGSKWLIRFVTTLYYTSERYRRLAAPLRGSNEDIMVEHRQIYKALASGEAEMAMRLMQNHIERTSILLTQLYRQSPPPETVQNGGS